MVTKRGGATFIYLSLCLSLLLLLLAACKSSPNEPSSTSPTPILAQIEEGVGPTPTLVPVLQPPPNFTPSVTPTPTATPSPTATPIPSQRIAVGYARLEQENYDQAIIEFEAVLKQRPQLSRSETANALYGLGIAFMNRNRLTDAADMFHQQLALTANDNMATTSTGEVHHQAAAPYFFLGSINAQLGEWRAAIGAYETYLVGFPDMAAYIYPRIAEGYVNLEQPEAAQEALLLAINNSAPPLEQHRLNRLQMAQWHIDQGDFAAAVTEYESIAAHYPGDQIQSNMAYLMGTTELLAGHPDAAYGHFESAVNQYPNQYDSYLALVELVRANQPVDEWQRGIINQNVANHEAAIAAFYRYVEQNPLNHDEQVHLYLADSYQYLGNVNQAIAELDELLTTADLTDTYWAPFWLRKAELQVYAGQWDEAAATYTAFVATFPDHEEAAQAALYAAMMLDNAGLLQPALEAYEAVVATYPKSDVAAEALFRAGETAAAAGESETAIHHWQHALDAYPQHPYAHAGLIAMMPYLPADKAIDFEPTVPILPAENYYTLRALTLLDHQPPFTPIYLPHLYPPFDAAAVEQWLASWADIPAEMELSQLWPQLSDDMRLQVGSRLWELGLREEAKTELESLRRAYDEEPLATYQLAQYFQELGLYRSSLIAGRNLLDMSGESIFVVPSEIGRLVYPIHFADLIIPAAKENGYDPFLLFSLVRQESLFEHFARSYVGARGLTQVMPATGDDIARWLKWPDYESESLYTPYVSLTFGAYYLNQQLNAFNGHHYAALSAYNGGPGNAARWLGEAGTNPDLFLETVDYAETRLYIRRIYLGYETYRHLYGNP